MLFRFLIKSTYDALPSPSKLVNWGLVTVSNCHKCHQKVTLMHILCGCPKQLTMYTYCHNQVLEVVGKDLGSLVARFNSQTPSSKVTTISLFST